MLRLRLLAPIVALVLALSSVLSTTAQEATPDTGFTAAGELDLAAMPVLPSDLEAIGRPGYGRFYNGYFNSLDQFSEDEAFFSGRDYEEVRGFYEGLGFRRMFGVAMGVPTTPGEESPPAGYSLVTIIELDEGGDADAYFDNLGVTGPDTEWSTSSVEAPFELGERAVVLNRSIYVADAGFAYHQLSVIFQTGSLLVEVGFGVDVYDDAGSPVATPVAAASGLESPAGTVDELEALGRRQLERIEDVRANGAPKLSDLLLRIGDDPLAASWDYTEGYRLLDGEIPPYYNGFEDDILADPNASIGAEAILELEERFVVGEDPEDGDPYFVSRIYAFPDEAAATAFMDGREAAFETGGIDLITGVNQEESEEILMPGEVTDLGDQSMAFSFVIADDLGSAEGYMIFVRVDGVVAWVWLEAPIEMTIDLLADIAAAQADCLAAGACPDAYPVPDGYLAEPAAPDATPEASPVA